MTLEESGAGDVEDAVLTVAGTTQRGQHPTAFTEGRLTVQVDLTPSCASLQEGVADAGVERLLHDRCRGAGGGRSG